MKTTLKSFDIASTTNLEIGFSIQEIKVFVNDSPQFHLIYHLKTCQAAYDPLILSTTKQFVFVS